MIHIKYGYQDFKPDEFYPSGRIVMFNGELYLTKTDATPNFFDLNVFEPLHKNREFIDARAGANISVNVAVKVTGYESERNRPVVTALQTGLEEIVGFCIQASTSGSTAIVIKRGAVTVAGLNSLAFPVGSPVYINPATGLATMTKTRLSLGFTLTQSSNAIIYIDLRTDIANKFIILKTSGELSALRGVDRDVVFVEDVSTFFEFRSPSTLTVNGYTVLATANSGSTRWVAVGGSALDAPIKSKANHLIIRNESGGTLLKNTVVKVVGLETATGIPIVTPIISVIDDPYGVVLANVLNNENGIAVQTGSITSTLDTSASALGNKFYADNSGVLTLAKTGLPIGSVTEIGVNANLFVNLIGHRTIQSYTNIPDMEGGEGDDNMLAYNSSLETFYRYETNGSSFTDDDKFILSTGDGGDTRWIGVAGRYVYGEVETKTKFKATAGATPTYTWEGLENVGMRAQAGDLFLSNDGDGVSIRPKGVTALLSGVVFDAYIDNSLGSLQTVTAPANKPRIILSNAGLNSVSDIVVTDSVSNQILYLSNFTGNPITLVSSATINISAFGTSQISIANGKTILLIKDPSNSEWIVNEISVETGRKIYYLNPDYPINKPGLGLYNDYTDLVSKMDADNAFLDGAIVYFDYEPTVSNTFTWEQMNEDNDWSKIEFVGTFPIDVKTITVPHFTVDRFSTFALDLKRMENMFVYVEGSDSSKFLLDPINLAIPDPVTTFPVTQDLTVFWKNTKIKFNQRLDDFIEVSSTFKLTIVSDNAVLEVVEDPAPEYTPNPVCYFNSGSFLNIINIGGRLDLLGLVFDSHASAVSTISLRDGSINLDYLTAFTGWAGSNSISFQDNGRHSNTGFASAENLRTTTVESSLLKLSGRIIGEVKLSASSPSDPGVEVTNNGKKYLVTGTASGTWTGQENKIAWYNGSAWQFIDCSQFYGGVLFETENGEIWIFTGTIWRRQLLSSGYGTIAGSTSLTRVTLKKFYGVDTSGGNIVIDLPPVADCAGIEIVFKKTTNDANTITLDPNSTETIEGATDLVYNTFNEVVRVYSTGTAWLIM